MSKLTESLASRLRHLMEKQGLTQASLSTSTGLARPQISNYLTGKTVPGVDNLEVMANALGVTAASLISTDNPKAAPPRKPSEEEMLAFMLSRFDLEEDRLEAVRLLLTVDPDTLDNCLLILRGAAPAKKNRQSSAG